MSLTIELSPDEESRLWAAARNQGIGPQEWARRVLTRHLPVPGPGVRTQALFAEWGAEDATADPDELEARAREWENLKRSMNESRIGSGDEPLFP
jgi:hypothetical protein